MNIEELPTLANIHSIRDLMAVTAETLRRNGIDPDKYSAPDALDLRDIDPTLAMWIADQMIRLDHLRFIESGGVAGRFSEQYGEPNPFED